MEIIKRKAEAEKKTIDTTGYNMKMQVSYNDWGHIVLRFFSENFTPLPTKWRSVCAHCGKAIHTYNGAYPDWVHDDSAKTYCFDDVEKATPNEDIPMTEPEDTLIALDVGESKRLIKFIKESIISGSDFYDRLNGIIKRE